MDIVFGVIVGLIVLTILVVLHELGHALVARRNGVVVEEFGVGFPPRAWSKTLKKSFLGKNVTYSVNWLPLGGFVKLQGEHDAADGKGDYGAATFWQKTKILLAGVAVNWLTAAVLLSILALFGLPKVLPNQFEMPGDTTRTHQPVRVSFVGEGMPAEKAGIKQGDVILKLDGQDIKTSQQLIDQSKELKGQTVEVVYERDAQQQTTQVALRNQNDDRKGYFGAGASQLELTRSTWSAPIVGTAVTAQMTGATLQGLGDLLVNAVKGLVLKFSGDETARQQADKDLELAGDSVSGPIGIFGVIFPAANQAGPLHVVLLTAIISLSLAVMNALPIPALDGGRWFVTALYRLLKKPLTKEREEAIHGTGFMILMGLIVLITIVDVGKILR